MRMFSLILWIPELILKSNLHSNIYPNVDVLHRIMFTKFVLTVKIISNSSKNVSWNKS